ncbi:polysaccharide pyruvyl transferase family protein [Butyrivibrio sp. CB08]|uniref:polysaccharide pyruvyl transferase family protein n=1 Tax=Butyrivibrio sp. CB08 TaxID=2364879 RepID=UPI000EA97493|nr:polysaccharide pyruvyl transferase family protein [Butyrivibrio sp. CB08]RKM59791.1 polysaccharide pyruvyl transferase family protein [Butyrivibrio sp. CB08]
MSIDLGRPIILYMHAGSGNHGCEAIADSLIRIIDAIRAYHGADTRMPIVLVTNSAKQDRKYKLGELEKSGLCTIVEENHIDRRFFDHVLYYGYRKITGDRESFLRYKFREAFRVYEDKCRELDVPSYEPAESGLRPLAVSIGGDNYCYPEMVEDLILAHNVFKEKGFDTLLWGCSIEPDSLKDNARLVEDLKSYTNIIARESISYGALLEAGIDKDKLEIRKDPAFELLKDLKQVPEKIVNGGPVGINLSPMVLDRAKFPDRVKESYRKFIRFILDTTDKDILLVPHVVWPTSDDRKPLSEFFEEFKDTGRVQMIEDNSAEVLKGYISCCSFFVGARTHSTIAAYSTGVPTLVIGYSVKSRGIATDLFGQTENYVLPVQEIEDTDSLIRSYQWIMENRK